MRKSKITKNYYLNPLQVDIIVEAIFGYLEPTEILLNCRKVCRKWNDIALQKRDILDKIPLRFNTAFEPPTKLNLKSWLKYSIDPTKKRNNLAEYFLYLDKSTGIKFTNISISEISLESQILQDFLNNWGHTVKHLTINWDYEEGNEDFVELFRKLLFSQCSNLKLLKFEKIPDFLVNSGFQMDFIQTTGIKELGLKYSFSRLESYEIFHRDILNACPLLEKLCSNEHKENLSIEIFLPALLKSDCSSTLREISLQCLNSNCLRVLNQSEELRLKRFRLEYFFDYGGFDKEGKGEFWRFMDRQKNTLECLEIGCFLLLTRINCPNNPISFPAVMPKLQRLEFGTDYTNKFARVNFPMTFPKLSELILTEEDCSGEYRNRHSLLTFSEAQLKLRMLHLPLYAPKQLEMVHAIFPKVTVLKAECKWNMESRKALSLWKELQILQVEFIPDVKEFAEEFLTIDEILTGNYLELRQTVAPTLTSLKDLRELNIHLKWRFAFKPEVVKNIRVHRELYKMPRLRLIVIQDFNLGVKIDESGYKKWRNRN